MGGAASAMRIGSYAAVTAAPSGGFARVDLEPQKAPTYVAGGPLAAAALMSSAAPTPEPPPPRPLSTVANIVLWISALGPVASVMMPIFYNIHTGNIKKTAKLFSTPGFVTAAYNAIVWLFYNTAVIKEDKTLDLAVSSATIASVAANYVMAVCAQRGQKRKGYVVGGSILASFGSVFAMARWDETPSKATVFTFGCLAILLLFVCLVVQFIDIVKHSSQKAEKIVIALNLLPTLIQNLGVFIVTFKYTPEQKFVLISSGIGALFSFLFLFIPFLMPRFGRFVPKFMRLHCEDEKLKRKRFMRLSCARPYKKARPSVQLPCRPIQKSAGNKIKKNIQQPVEGNEKLEVLVTKGTDHGAGNRSRSRLNKLLKCLCFKTE